MKATKPKAVPVGIKLSPPLFERVESFARLTRRTKTATIQMCIEAALPTLEKSDPIAATNPK